LATFVASGLALGYVAVAIYFFVTGGTERIKKEFSGEVAAERRATGERLPFTPVAVWVLWASVGFGLGIGGWKRVARRAGLTEQEIGAVIGSRRRLTSA